MKKSYSDPVCAPLTNIRESSNRERTKPILLGVTLLAWTFPRIGFLKLTELLVLLNLTSAFSSKRTLKLSVLTFGPFLIATLFAAYVGIFYLGSGDNSLTSDKVLQSTPELMIFFTAFRTLLYVAVVIALLHFFRTASIYNLRRALSWGYILTLLPGLLQIARIYTGFYFDIPFFEREGFGPFTGVFDAGYLRIMGFDFEPLAYATSLSVVCCLRFYARGRIPTIGLLLLAHTFSVGAIAAFSVALLTAYPKRFRHMLVPIYTLVLIVFSVFLWTYLDELLNYFIFIQSVSERINAWGSCINMWLDHPLGVGLGLYSYFHNFYDQVGLGAPQLDFYPNNDPLMFLASGGVLYLLTYLWIFHSGFCATPSRWVRVALMGLMIQSASSSFFLILQLQRRLWVCNITPTAKISGRQGIITTHNFNESDLRVKAVNTIIRILARLIGINRTFQLLRYASLLTREMHFSAVLMKEPLDLRHISRR